MARKLSLTNVQVMFDPDDHSVIGWHVYFEHCDSVKTHDKAEGSYNVTAAVTDTEGFTATNGIRDDIIADVKAYVTNSGAHAGEGNYDGVYDGETWTN